MLRGRLERLLYLQDKEMVKQLKLDSLADYITQRAHLLKELELHNIFQHHTIRTCRVGEINR